MGQQSSPLAAPAGMPMSNAANLGQFVGIDKNFATFAAMTTAIGAERSTPVGWVDGEKIACASEAASYAYREWSATNKHARKVTFAPGYSITLAADTNTVYAVNPASSLGANGDASVDWSTGKVYLKTAGAWAITFTIVGAGAQAAISAVATAVTAAQNSANAAQATANSAAAAVAALTPTGYQLTGAHADGVTDDYPIFKAAALSGAAAITVPSGTYFLNNAGGDKLANMVVFGSQLLICQPGVIFKFSYNGLPLFTWCNANSGGIAGSPEFVFTGPTIVADEYTRAQVQTRLGLSTIIGGNYENACVLFRINSNNVKFGDLSFRSATPGDATKGISFCIVDKGMETSSPPVPSVGLTLGACTFEDCIHGLLATRQDRFDYAGPFTSRRRFGNTYCAPGHIIYLSGSSVNGYMTNGSLGDTYDLGFPVTIGDGRCIGPWAIKGVSNSKFGTLVSRHPEGLIQSAVELANNTFGRMTWDYTGTQEPTASHLNFAGGLACVNNKFSQIEMFSTSVFARIQVTSDMAGALFTQNEFCNVFVRCPANRGTGIQRQVMTMFGDSNTYNLQWEPSTAPVQATYNYAVSDGAGVGNTINLTMIGPNTTSLSAQVDSSGFVSITTPNQGRATPFNSRTLTPIDNGGNYTTTTSQVVTVPTGLRTDFYCDFDGPVTFSGTGITDSRQSGAGYAVCTIRATGTNTYRVVGVTV